jgi:uncharacterized protein YeaC (DUF1315 family)
MKKLNKSKYLNTLDNINNDLLDNNKLNTDNDNNNKLIVINLNNIEELNNVANMTDGQIEAWLQLVMLGKVQANKEQLSAADKLLKTRGMYEKNKTIGTNGGAVYKWKSTVEAEIVHEESTTPDMSVLNN